MYSLDKSADFKYLPRLNADLLETESRVGELVLSEVINRGQFSIVRRCAKGAMPGMGSRKQSTANLQYTLAIKTVPKDALTSIESVLGLENELRAMRELQPHPNLLALRDCLHGTQNIYLVTEGIACDLFDFFEANQHLFDDNIVAVLLREVAAGLGHMHAHRVVHRDLKCENVLVEFTSHASRHNVLIVKLCDFGLVRFVGDTSTILTEYAGSPGFFAPEALLHSAFCGVKADVFSLGAVALELLVPQTFFQSQWLGAYQQRTKDPHIFSAAMREAVQAAHKEARRCHALVDIQDFLQSTLQLDAAARPTAAALARHPWIQSANSTAACEVLNQKKKVSRHALLPVVSGGGRACVVGSLPGARSS